MPRHGLGCSCYEDHRQRFWIPDYKRRGMTEGGEVTLSQPSPQGEGGRMRCGGYEDQRERHWIPDWILD